MTGNYGEIKTTKTRVFMVTKKKENKSFGQTIINTRLCKTDNWCHRPKLRRVEIVEVRNAFVTIPTARRTEKTNYV